MYDAFLEVNSSIIPEAKSFWLQHKNITSFLKTITGKIDFLQEVVPKQNSKTLAYSPADKSEIKAVMEKSLEEKLVASGYRKLVERFH